ncbi:hypothetical protein NDU88_008231 [Pleurodeles waltl]|uniref:Uncharacterized protein n=1 Tax=Pleurodeles waltl TaxID=8319 RepID=A0AAV7NDN0_PLEWA|nr:hypothetical protein NDU88_008231 [Pleurodeles waltl]
MGTERRRERGSLFGRLEILAWEAHYRVEVAVVPLPFPHPQRQARAFAALLKGECSSGLLGPLDPRGWGGRTALSLWWPLLTGALAVPLRTGRSPWAGPNTCGDWAPTHRAAAINPWARLTPTPPRRAIASTDLLESCGWAGIVNPCTWGECFSPVVLDNTWHLATGLADLSLVPACCVRWGVLEDYGCELTPT